jgi:hypothetical protein
LQIDEVKIGNLKENDANLLVNAKVSSNLCLQLYVQTESAEKK